MTNKLQLMLQNGGIAVGPFIKLTSPAIVEIFGHAGFDFVVIDTEHGPMNIESAENLVRAAKLVGITPIIRVRSNDPSLISRALDIGAGGVQVPQVSTAEQAKSVVRASRFAPDGERGVCCYVRAASYSHVNKHTYFKQANRDILVIVHIEGAEGVANLPDIVTVEGIDVIFIGPYDLSQSLGIPGEVEHPLVIGKMQQIVKVARKAGVVVGTFVDDINAAKKWMNAGIQYVSYSVDVGILYKASFGLVKQLKDDQAGTEAIMLT
ncbi:MAG TPA: aldolase/citrate lyase family protein [Candidatus Limnocylindrales bacterium]|nr:aldolase/citrate lyase family protein [Candidatus Limnocylindrales bacterium]